ncbi:hypothetical protein FGB62_333g09 [Gracilaria domingensis]|nr:hypothetical protein FGB62_333g09 [Gracilaria domingensis]
MSGRRIVLTLAGQRFVSKELPREENAGGDSGEEGERAFVEGAPAVASTSVESDGGNVKGVGSAEAQSAGAENAGAGNHGAMNTGAGNAGNVSVEGAALGAASTGVESGGAEMAENGNEVESPQSINENEEEEGIEGIEDVLQRLGIEEVGERY